MPVPVSGKIKPLNGQGYPVVEDVDMHGGLQTVPDAATRLAIPSTKQKLGMLVYQEDDQNYYTVTTIGDPATWAIAQLGGSTPGGDLGGTSTSQIVEAIHGIPTPTSAGTSDQTFVLEAAPIGEVMCFYEDTVNNTLWCGQFGTLTLLALDATTLALKASVPNAMQGSVGCIRRVAGDSNNVYCISPQNGSTFGGLISIISKTTYQVIGYLQTRVGSTNGFGRDVCVDAHGNVWGINEEFSTISKFTPASIAAAITNNPTPQDPDVVTTLTGSSTNVETCCYDPDHDQIWVTEDTTGTLYNLDINGNILNSQVGSNITGGPIFHEVQYYQGFVWCADYNTRNTIWKVDPVAFPSPSAFTAIVTPTNLGGDIYIDTHTQTLLVQDQTGSRRNPSVGPVITRLNAPAGTIASHISFDSTHSYMTAIPVAGGTALAIGDLANNGLLLYTNTPGSETPLGPAGLSMVYDYPVIWEFDGNPVTPTYRRLNIQGNGISLTTSTDGSNNPCMLLDISGGILYQDHGSTLGQAVIMNFTGSGVTNSFSSGTATITISGGGGAVINGANVTVPPTATGNQSMVGGNSATDNGGNFSVVLGPGAVDNSSGNGNNVIIGNSPISTGYHSIAIGHSARASTGTSNVVIGYNAGAPNSAYYTGHDDVVIGTQAGGSLSSYGWGIGIGFGARPQAGNYNIAMGYQAVTGGSGPSINSSICIGNSATSNDSGVSIGNNAGAPFAGSAGVKAVGIGYQAGPYQDFSVALGPNSFTQGVGELATCANTALNAITGTYPYGHTPIGLHYNVFVGRTADTGTSEQITLNNTNGTLSTGSIGLNNTSGHLTSLIIVEAAAVGTLHAGGSISRAFSQKYIYNYLADTFTADGYNYSWGDAGASTWVINIVNSGGSIKSASFTFNTGTTRGVFDVSLMVRYC